MQSLMASAKHAQTAAPSKGGTGFATMGYRSMNTKVAANLTQNSLLKKNFFKKNLTFGTSVNPENIKVNENIFPESTLPASLSPNP